MNCPKCQHIDSKVIDSRANSDYVRRRRECLQCQHKWTTNEIHVDLVDGLMPDLRRNDMDLEKLINDKALELLSRTAKALSNAQTEPLPGSPIKIQVFPNGEILRRVG